MTALKPLAPGQPGRATQQAELEFWTAHLAHWNLHLGQYLRVFAFDDIEWSTADVLDVGSGPISVFEHAALAGARVTPYDSLADEYNRLAPDKRFAITATFPSRRFSLITLFNVLDHMDRPDELLQRLSTVLASDGTVWIYCHIDRPFGAEHHPQDFSFRDLIVLVDGVFTVRQCGLIREGRLFPYAWWGICGPRAVRSPLVDRWRRAGLLVRCALQYGRFHLVRAQIKAVKLIGLRRLLPKDLQF